MASERRDLLVDLRKSRKQMEKFFPILDDFFIKFEKRLLTSTFEEVVEEKVLKRIVVELNTQSKESFLMFFIPAELYRILQASNEFDATLVRNESLAFLEWIIKFHLFLHSKAIETSSLQSKEILKMLDDTICGVLERSSTSDAAVFASIFQSYLKLINQLIEFVKGKECINQELHISEFSYFTNQVKVTYDNGLIPKSDIILKLESMEKIETVFVSLCEVFKRIKEVFILHMEISDNSKYGSQFLTELLEKAFSLKNFKVKIHCLDMYFSSVGIEPLKYFSNHSFLAIFSLCTAMFLNFSDNEAYAETELMLIQWWKCLSKKLLSLDNSLCDGTYVVNILVFLLRNICVTSIKNWKNNLFQQVIPEVLGNFVRICILKERNTTLDLFKYLFEFFLTNAKLIHFKSPWINLVTGMTVEELLTSTQSQAASLPSDKSSSFLFTSVSPLTSTTTAKSSISFDENDDDTYSMDDEEDEEEESDHEPNEILPDNNGTTFIQSLWKNFMSITAKTSFDRQDVHIFIIICEVINHLHFSNEIHIIENNMNLKKISNFVNKCCEAIELHNGNELTCRIGIISSFAKVNFCVLINSEEKLDSNLLCRSLLKPWDGSIKSQTVKRELLEAFDFSVDGLVYFNEDLYPTQRLQLFLLKSKHNYSDVAQNFPLYWHLLDDESAAKALLDVSPHLIPKLIGHFCCIGTGKIGKPTWNQSDFFNFSSLSISCCICKGISSESALINSEALEQVLGQKFLSIIENLEDIDSLISLLNNSAVQFFNHTSTDNLKIIDAFLATFSIDISGSNRAVHRIIPSFVNRFSCNERYASLLFCFKRRFGSECEMLKEELRWSEISHIINFGSHVEGELLVEVLVYLVRRCWQKAYIKTQIEHLARMKKISVNELFIRCQPSLSARIIDFLTVNYSESYNCSGYLQTFISSFSSDKMEHSSSQISKQVPTYVIPYLIMQRTEKSLHLLKSVVPSDLAVDGDFSRLISAYWFEIIKVIINNIQTAEINAALKYLQDLCKEKSLKDLFVAQSCDIRTYLFCNLHTHHSSSFDLLSKLDYYENKCKKNLAPPSKICFTQECFNEYFIGNMRPFFTMLNKMLTNSDINVNDKIEAFNSLVDILNSLESQQIVTIEIPYKAALRSAFQHWKKYHLNWNKSNSTLFIGAIIDNWKSYINNHPSLHNQIIEISNDLVPLLPINADSTSQLFKTIIVDRSAEFCDCFSDLHFLPKNIPEMNIVHTTIKNYLDKSEAHRVDLAKKIEQVINNLASDNPEVKIHHLRQLLDLLRSSRRSLHELRVPRKDESSNYIIRKLLRTLMGSCIPYDNLHLVIAECLGEIGAIDPGRLDLVNYQNANRKILPFNVNDTSFAVMLITELSSILDDKPESRIHDCVYYAIQEVLRVCGVERNCRNEIWNSLSESLQNICSSLFNSHYDVQYDFQNTSSNMQSPIYNTSLDYKDWIFQWIVKLTTLILSPKPRQLFTSCLATVKHSCSFARFLLPFVLLYALIETDGDNKKSWIIGEIEAIMKLSAGSALGCTFPYPMTSPMESKLSISTTQLVEIQHLCVQTIFSVLDSLDKWVYFIKPTLQKSAKDHQQKKRAPSPDHLVNLRSSSGSNIVCAVKSLSKGLLKSDLSNLAFSCQSYARALRYMERHMRRNMTPMNYWETIQKYYAALDDADGVEGVTVKMGHAPSLKDAILAHEVKGQFQDVLSCCEKGTKVDPTDIEYVKIQIRCLMNLDSPSTASKVALGYISNNSKWKSDLIPYMVEAAWKLSSWTELESLLKYDSCLNPDVTVNVGIGKLFNFALRRDLVSFNETLKHLRQKEMNPIAAAAMESGAYIRGYSHLVRLHMLNDIEYGLRQLFISNDQRDMKCMLQEWRNRNSVVQSCLRFLEPIVNLQRVIIQIDNENTNQCVQEFAKSLLLSAKIARKSGHMQRAYNCILEAERGTEPFEIPISLRSQLLIERSKYHWAKGEQYSAVTHLQKGLSAHFSSFNEDNSLDVKKAFMKVKLLYATYADQTSSLQSNDLIKLYNEVTNYSSNWEEPYFRLAKYYDKLLPTIVEDKQKSETMILIIESFKRSLEFGAKHVNESVPRMLTVWFDLGSLCISESAKKRGPTVLYQKACEKVISGTINTLLFQTPSYYYMTCLPQLLSRICHPYEKIRETLRKLISGLMTEYPKQTFWMLVGTLNNSAGVSSTLRRQQCEQILSDASNAKHSLKEYFHKAKLLSQLFIELCNSTSHFTMIPKIKQLLSSSNKNSENQILFLLPYQRLMNVRLPSKLHHHDSQNDYHAFSEAVYIFDISTNVEVLKSLQKPKKITLIGSDGKNYVMMCKPKDDLRKDQRTMEFMNLVNFHLKKDPETRKRQLAIRTYTVVPLNHECGLVEWVDDLRSVREIIHNLYYAKGVDHNQIRQFFCVGRDLSSSERIVKFKQAMKDLFEPAVFSKFFLQNFSDPTAWYLARLAYVRSCAVMSIVGYIIGLGDRHLENILINVVTGNLVHVDFNVLFNRGESLQFPELVPFRLTHNMIDAMGATGYEGAFRITCETTLRVMREQIDALMSVLKPFVYDPLLEGKEEKKSKGTQNKKSGYEVIPEQALQSVNDIEDRLKGLPRRDNKQMGRTPISVSGHVSYLIEEATNVQNLGSMYIGWSPFF